MLIGTSREEKKQVLLKKIQSENLKETHENAVFINFGPSVI